MTRFNGIGITIPLPADSAFDQALSRAQEINGALPPRLSESVRRATRDGVVTAEEYEQIAAAAKRDLGLGPFSSGRLDTFDLRQLEALAADPKIELAAVARQHIVAEIAAARAALARGEIRSGAFVDEQGVIHELCQGRIEVPYEEFLAVMDPADWSPNLPQYRGGEVRELSHALAANGHAIIHQQERMSLGVFPNILDMTKNTIVDKGPDSARITWEVVHSDPTAATFFMRSVRRDNGYIELSRTEDGAVLVTTRSAHLIATPASKVAQAMARDLGGALTAKQLGEYFVAVIAHYREIAAGKIPARAVERRR